MIAKTTAWSMVKQHPAMVAAARLAAGDGNVVIYSVPGEFRRNVARLRSALTDVRQCRRLECVFTSSGPAPAHREESP